MSPCVAFIFFGGFMKLSFKEILEKEKAKQKPVKQWHYTACPVVHNSKKKYSRKNKHKNSCM